MVQDAVKVAPLAITAAVGRGLRKLAQKVVDGDGSIWMKLPFSGILSCYHFGLRGNFRNSFYRSLISELAFPLQERRMVPRKTSTAGRCRSSPKHLLALCGLHSV